MATIFDVMIAIRENRSAYYHKDTHTVDFWPISKIEGENIDLNEKLTYPDENNFPLPSAKEIDNNNIMRYFVKEFIDDKVMRKALFNILQRHKYEDAFVEKLKEFDEFDNFHGFASDIYYEIFVDWAKENNLDFSKKPE